MSEKPVVCSACGETGHKDARSKLCKKRSSGKSTEGKVLSALVNRDFAESVRTGECSFTFTFGEDTLRADLDSHMLSNSEILGAIRTLVSLFDDESDAESLRQSIITRLVRLPLLTLCSPTV